MRHGNGVKMCVTICNLVIIKQKINNRCRETLRNDVIRTYWSKWN